MRSTVFEPFFYLVQYYIKHILLWSDNDFSIVKNNRFKIKENIVERGKIDTLNTQIYDYLLS